MSANCRARRRAQCRDAKKITVATPITCPAIFTTGEPLEPGCIYDSNRYTLRGMLQRLGCEIIDLGVVRDDPTSLEAALRGACAQADAIIDFTTPASTVALAELAAQHPRGDALAGRRLERRACLVLRDAGDLGREADLGVRLPA